ncbi:MAG: heat shock protein Hsp20 [Betaproteobacteria bacterium]|nr:heat shock protein Hsp20 [Betaproteobacteria bacterium]
MSLTLYRDPFAASFDDVLRGFFARPAQRQQQQPAVRAIRFDVAEQGNAYVVSAELPGYKKEDVQVEIDGARVTITAEAKTQNEAVEGEKVVYSERYTGKAVRSFELTSEIDNDTASAKYENGILTLTLPKKTAETRKLLNIA